MKSLFEIAQDSDVQVEYCRLPENQSLSAPILGSCYVAMDYSLLGRAAEERVHLAHELGHCVTGSFYNLYAPCDLRGRHEERADRWAIRQLVPRRELGEALREGVTEVWDLAERFQVTQPFMEKAIQYYKMLESD